MITIRSEISSDRLAIDQVNQNAFGQVNESIIINALRKDGALRYSIVALEENQVVGHLAISPVSIVETTTAENATTHQALGLGPVAVDPRKQNCGIGSQLISYWFNKLAEPEDQLIVVLGHPAYYPRFGFKPAYQFGIRWEVAVRKEAFMVAELSAGALDTISGVVSYHPSFTP